MFNDKYNKNETEEFAKNSKQKDLDVGTFATIAAIRGKQFGKEVFATVIKFKDLMDFLKVFPEVQRDVNNRKVVSIKNYVLTGLDDPENAMRFFPAITATARGHIYYDEFRNQVAIDTNNSKLSINDGQHRFYGVNEAIRVLNGKLNKIKDTEEREKIKESLDRLKEMMLPMTIFNNLTESEEKQLFHDTNNLAQRPSRSATIKLAQTDLFSVLSRELSESNRYLKYYGVEMDKNSIAGNNENSILLTTVHEVARRLVWDETRKGRSTALAGRYDYYKKYIGDTFDKMFLHLPGDFGTKGKYILEKHYALKGIAKFIHDNRLIRVPDEEIFATLEKVNWEIDIEYWKQYGGQTTKRGKLAFGGGGEHGRIAVLDALYSQFPYDVGDYQLSLEEMEDK
ncbi:MAG: DNA sulfur modification protein DndB [Bacillota bacterium]